MSKSSLGPVVLWDELAGNPGITTPTPPFNARGDLSQCYVSNRLDVNESTIGLSFSCQGMPLVSIALGHSEGAPRSVANTLRWSSTSCLTELRGQKMAQLKGQNP